MESVIPVKVDAAEMIYDFIVNAGHADKINKELLIASMLGL
jgi:hypothetical protein